MKQRKGKSRLKKVFLLLTCLAFLFALFGSIYIFGLGTWKAFDVEKITNVQETLLLYDESDELMTEIAGKENRQKVSLDNIPKHVQNAFIAIEDVRFYSHPGIDVKRIVGAFVADIKSGSLSQGGSTLTQQLIKLSHLTNDKKWSRKIQEALLALQMERTFSKDQILEMYLNYVYFGAGAYGVEAASREYFSKGCGDLTLAEGAMLAAILKAPSRYAPHIDLEASVKRRNLVLSVMHSNGFISTEQMVAAQREVPHIVRDENATYKYGFYTELAMSEAKNLLGISQEELLSGGYRVYTSLDTSLQEYCEELFKDDKLFPESAEDGTKVEAAAAILDAKSHSIKALLGGREHKVKMGFNRATMLRRQPGSAIKPVIVYAPAIEKFGYTATTFLLDEPTDFAGYTPRNFGEHYNGWVTMRQAVTKSLNIPAVKVFSDIGVQTGKLFASDVGIEFDDHDTSLTLALGGFTHGVSPLQLSGAYAMFADKGQYQKPQCIRRITDVDGNVLYDRPTEKKQMMSEENSFILTSMLQSVVDEGTGKNLKIGIPLAGKTGTTGLINSEGNKDAWMAAYNADYSAVVWMGFDDTNSAHCLPSKATGGTYPAQVLSHIFSYIYTDKPAPNFTIPHGVHEIKLDAQTLSDRREVMLANALTPADKTITEYYSAGKEPEKITDYWKVPAPPIEFRVAPDDDGMPVIAFSPPDKLMLYRIYRKQLGFDPVLISEIPGNSGDVAKKDITAVFGQLYEYYVLPVHPELQLGGNPIIGPSTKSILFSPADVRSVSVAVSDELSEASSKDEPPKEQNSSARKSAKRSQSSKSSPTPKPSETANPVIEDTESALLATPDPQSQYSTPKPSSELYPSPTPSPAHQWQNVS